MHPVECLDCAANVLPDLATPETMDAVRNKGESAVRSVGHHGTVEDEAVAHGDGGNDTVTSKCPCYSHVIKNGSDVVKVVVSVITGSRTVYVAFKYTSVITYK